MSAVVARAGRIVGRFLMLFFRLERQPCGYPDCRCKSHEVVGISRIGCWVVGALMVAEIAGCAWCIYR